MSDKSLKRCPFCGGNAKVLEDCRFETKPYNFPKWYIACTKCGVKTAVGPMDCVVKTWNKRTEGTDDNREESAYEVFVRLLSEPVKPARRVLRAERNAADDGYCVKLLYNDGTTEGHVFHENGRHEVNFSEK